MPGPHEAGPTEPPGEVEVLGGVAPRDAGAVRALVLADAPVLAHHDGADDVDAGGLAAQVDGHGRDAVDALDLELLAVERDARRLDLAAELDADHAPAHLHAALAAGDLRLDGSRARRRGDRLVRLGHDDTGRRGRALAGVRAVRVVVAAGRVVVA